MYGNFESPKFIASVAKSMLWYPAGEYGPEGSSFPFVHVAFPAYIALMFPHLIVCFINVSGIKVTFNARIFTAACSALLGK